MQLVSLLFSHFPHVAMTTPCQLDLDDELDLVKVNNDYYNYYYDYQIIIIHGVLGSDCNVKLTRMYYSQFFAFGFVSTWANTASPAPRLAPWTPLTRGPAASFAATPPTPPSTSPP